MITKKCGLISVLLFVCLLKTRRLRHGCTWLLMALSSTCITAQQCTHGYRICLAWIPLSFHLSEMGRRAERSEIKPLTGKVTSLTILSLPDDIMNGANTFTWWSNGRLKAIFFLLSVHINAESQDPASSWRSLIPVIKVNISTVSTAMWQHRSALNGWLLI